MQIFKRYWSILFIFLCVFLLGIIPSVLSQHLINAAFYYGSLFFTVLLVGSIALLFFVATRSASEGQERDYRVIHFGLRIALTLGIGAVIVAVLFLVAVLGLMPI